MPEDIVLFDSYSIRCSGRDCYVDGPGARLGRHAARGNDAQYREQQQLSHAETRRSLLARTPRPRVRKAVPQRGSDQSVYVVADARLAIMKP